MSVHVIGGSASPTTSSAVAADRLITITRAVVVLGVAVVAAIVSYEHAYVVIRAHGEDGWMARLVPLTVDGLIYSSSMVMLQSGRRRVKVPALALWLLALGIVATLAPTQQARATSIWNCSAPVSETAGSSRNSTLKT